MNNLNINNSNMNNLNINNLNNNISYDLILEDTALLITDYSSKRYY